MKKKRKRKSKKKREGKEKEKGKDCFVMKKGHSLSLFFSKRNYKQKIISMQKRK